jgi:hypothetical protein
MRNLAGSAWGRFALATVFLVISILTFVVGVMNITMWELVKSFGPASQHASTYIWPWVLMTAATLQLVFAGMVGRIVADTGRGRGRLVFDFYSVAAAGFVVYTSAVERAPFLIVAVCIALFAVWMIAMLEKRWLEWLAYVWVALVALVLGSVVYYSSLPVALVWVLVLCAALLAVRGARGFGIYSQPTGT